MNAKTLAMRAPRTLLHTNGSRFVEQLPNLDWAGK